MFDRDKITGTFTWTPPPGDLLQSTTTATIVSIILESLPTTPLGVYDSSKISGGPLTSGEGTRNVLTDPGPTSTTTIHHEDPRPVSTPVVVESPPVLAPMVVPMPTESPVIPIITELPGFSTSQPTPIGSSPGVVSVRTTSPPASSGSSVTPSTFTTSFTTLAGSGPLIPLITVTTPPTTKAPHLGLPTITIASIAAGGVGALVFFIGLIYFLRRAMRAKSGKGGAGIKNRISNPVPPSSEKAETVRTFPGCLGKRFSQDSKAALLARTITGSSRTEGLGPSSPSWSSVIPQVQVSPGSSPPRTYIPMLEPHTLPTPAPGPSLRPGTPTPRIVSSIYPTYGETNENLDPTPINPRYTGNPTPGPYITYDSTGNPHSTPIRNLTPPAAPITGRRRRADVVSSWMSNENYQFERQAESDRSSYISNFAFELGDVGNRMTFGALGRIPEDEDTPGSVGRGSPYGSILDLYKTGGLAGVEEVEGEEAGGSRGGGDSGTTSRWEHERRVLFGGK